MNIEIPKDVKEFVKMVSDKAEGWDVYLGGGFLRDSYVNQTKYAHPYDQVAIKDVDLFFAVSNSWCGTSTPELPVIPKTYINYDLSDKEVSEDMRDRGVCHLRGMFYPSLENHKEVQFIVYENPMNIEELAKDMDCTINQVMYCPDTEEIYCTKDFILDHDKEIIRMTHSFSKERMAKRLFRMQEKFHDYDIDTSLDLDYYEYVKCLPERGGSGCE